MPRYNVSDSQFAEAVRNHSSIAQVLKSLGLHPTGGNYKQVHKRVHRLQIDTRHWTGQGHLRGKSHNWNPRFPTDTLLVENSGYTNTTALKRRFIKEGLLIYQCFECGISEWREKSLSLVLDHVNGINNDHRLENLRFLCPNCNSQTDTFAGRNKGKIKR